MSKKTSPEQLAKEAMEGNPPSPIKGKEKKLTPEQLAKKAVEGNLPFAIKEGAKIKGK